MQMQTPANLYIYIYIYIYIKGRVYSSRPGFRLTYRVDQVLSGQLLNEFLPRFGPILNPNQPARPVQVSKL
jgi:hypothetical protein